ncbi:MAG: hypothetical protein EHM28_12715 [Spirochaetaceae bacterium]|nr:MAG: hypothetical protein EHM28_12715 [Spirochaetaceae bacterium]
MKETAARFAALDIVLVCGLPGSGKSHFAREYFKASGRKRINRNEIRRHLFEMMSFGEPWKESCYREEDEALVKHIEHKLLEHILFLKHKVLIDNISITSDSRKFYIDLAKKMNKTIGAIFLDTPVQDCMARNQKRKDPLPDSVISNLYASVEHPDIREGLAEAIAVKPSRQE